MSGPLDLLVTGLDVGGAETQVVRLGTSLYRRGWAVRVISLLDGGALRRPLVDAGIPTLHLGMRRGLPDPRGLARLVRLLRRNRTAVLLSFAYHANVLGRIAGRLAGLRTVISSLRNEHFGGRARDLLLRWTDGLGQLNIANSEAAARSLVQRGVVPGRRIQVIPNGLDVSAFERGADVRRLSREALGIAEHEFLWISVGRLVPQKDHDTLLEALARPAGWSDPVLVVGDGPARDHLSRRIERLGLTTRVRLLGTRSDIPELLAAADALVLSSAWEGMPNVVLEAFAAALPVVATRVGGVPELVLEGDNGFLAVPGDPGSLAQAMDRLRALPPPARTALGRSGRDRIRRCFDVEAITDRWEEVLSLGRLALQPGDRRPGSDAR